jgi:opacity protein-like surface antigen
MKKILLTTVAVAAFATGASAMEAGKMYMKSNVGYNFSSPSLDAKLAGSTANGLFTNTKSSNRLKGFAGDIGFGYALSDSVRTDLTLSLSQGKKTLKDVKLLKKIGDVESTNSAKIKLTEKKIGLMANAYYDFHNSSEFTPYVMAGVGLNRGTLEANINGDNGATPAVAKSKTIKSKNLTSFAYNIGVGVGYEMTKDVYLDAGYKLSGSTGSYKFKEDVSEINAKAKDKLGSPKIQHTISAGVRFAF